MVTGRLWLRGRLPLSFLFILFFFFIVSRFYLRGHRGSNLLSHPFFLVSRSMNAYMAKLFPIHVRYSGVAFSYSIGMALFGGTTPVICTLLIQKTGNHLSPAFYIFGLIRHRILRGVKFSKEQPLDQWMTSAVERWIKGRGRDVSASNLVKAPPVAGLSIV